MSSDPESSQGLSENALRAAILRDLPADALRPRPLRALLMIPLLAIIGGGTAALVALPLPAVLALPMALAVGNTYGSLLHLGHEICHGAAVRSTRLQNLLMASSLAIFCVSPGYWRLWHNQSHHGHTNMPDADPDSLGTVTAQLRGPAWSRKVLLTLAPGSGHWLTWFYMLFAFTVHAQITLWRNSRSSPGFSGLRRGRAGLYSAAMAAFWALLAIASGPRGALFGVVIPMLTANFVVMMYIVTNHMLRPLSTSRDSLTTSMSVTAHPLLDWMHFHFSHHIEHHLFPAMGSDYYPLVRESLRRRAGGRFFAPPFSAALRMVFSTPRIYEDAMTLVDPERGTRAELPAVEAALRGAEARARPGLKAV